MDVNGYERLFREKLSKLLDGSKEMSRIFKATRNGVATYEEAHAFAVELSRICGEVFGSTYSYIADLPLDEFADYIVGNVANQNLNLVKAICTEVQYDLNTNSGLGINPVDVVTSQEQIDKVVEKIRSAAAKGEESLRIALKDPVRDETLKMIDNYVKENAYFQKRLGLSPQMVRVWDGTWGSHDTRHTDICRELAGAWDYGDQPSEFFMRHEGCQCKCLYYPTKKAKGQIMALAKGEKDTYKQLDQTGNYTSNSRQAVLRRRRETFGKEKAREMLNAEWKGGFNGNAERHFS